jgi:hypothetical protein
MTRREYVEARKTGRNPRLWRLVPATNTALILDRIASLKRHRVRSTRPMGQIERVALVSLPRRMSELLARLPLTGLSSPRRLR